MSPRSSLRPAGLLAVCASLCASSFAAPTALNSIPSTDVLGHREASLVYTLAGTERKISKRYSHANSLQLGLFDRLEFGFDNDFDGFTPLNLKVGLAMPGDVKRLPGLALCAGYANHDGLAAEPYVVFSHPVACGRLTCGYAHSGGRHRALLGWDQEIMRDTVLMLDHTSSVNGFTWVGLSYNIAAVPGLSVWVGAARPNTSGDGTQHSASLTYNFRF
ncbi:MAG: hypothetical protein JNM85_02970 [Chthonomonas sp.]|nr:hypothetical protein [Chthonomonas sp.]